MLKRIQNVNSVSVHNFSKCFLLRTYISIHKFDIICISKTFLNSDTALDHENLMIEGYDIVRSDHSILDIKYFQECIVFQVLLGNKPCIFISLHLPPSQTTDIFDQFADNLELTFDEVANHNSFLIVIYNS